jgi:hypothetical protein
VSQRATIGAAADDDYVIVLTHHAIIQAHGALVITRER